MSTNRRHRQILAMVEDIMQRHPGAKDHILVFYCQGNGSSKLGLVDYCRPEGVREFLNNNRHLQLAGILSLVDGEPDGNVLASIPAGANLELRNSIVEQMKNRLLEPPTADQERATAQEVLRLMEQEASRN
jgi:hypothetical protein